MPELGRLSSCTPLKTAVSQSRKHNREALDHALEKLFTHTYLLTELNKTDAPFFLPKSKTICYSQIYKASSSTTTCFEGNMEFLQWLEKKLLYLAETLNLKVFWNSIEAMDPIFLCPLWTDFVPKGNHDTPTKQKLSPWNISIWVTLALTSHVQWGHHAFAAVIVDLWRYYESIFFRYIYLFHSVSSDKCVIKRGQRKIRIHLTKVLQVLPGFRMLNTLQNFLKEYWKANGLLMYMGILCTEYLHCWIHP